MTNTWKIWQHPIWTVYKRKHCSTWASKCLTGKNPQFKLKNTLTGQNLIRIERQRKCMTCMQACNDGIHASEMILSGQVQGAGSMYHGRQKYVIFAYCTFSHTISYYSSCVKIIWYLTSFMVLTEYIFNVTHNIWLVSASLFSLIFHWLWQGTQIVWRKVKCTRKKKHPSGSRGTYIQHTTLSGSRLHANGTGVRTRQWSSGRQWRKGGGGAGKSSEVGAGYGGREGYPPQFSLNFFRTKGRATNHTGESGRGGEGRRIGEPRGEGESIQQWEEDSWKESFKRPRSVEATDCACRGLLFGKSKGRWGKYQPYIYFLSIILHSIRPDPTPFWWPAQEPV